MANNSSSDCRIRTLKRLLDDSDTQFVSNAQDKMVHPRLAGSEQTFQGELAAARIQVLFGDSAKFDYRPNAGQCDLVLVDAGYEYDYVKSDTKNALRLLAPEGGLSVWHDFPNTSGVCAWLEELSALNAFSTSKTPAWLSRRWARCVAQVPPLEQV